MDAHRFDTLTKHLAASTTRRRMVAALGGLLTGALLGRGGAAADDCKPAGKTCKKDSQCCSGFCFGADPNVKSTAHNPGVCCSAAPNGDSCTANGDCCSNICQAGTCVATEAGTCTAASGTCGNGICSCITDAQGALVCAGPGLCGGDIHSQADCPAGTFFVPSAPLCGGLNGCVQPPCPPVLSCFTGETRIAMADGTSKPIELVEVGDRVLGHDGINRVEAIERPRLGQRRLYALNDGAFFVTAEHPFLTAEGWKAIDPAATAAENPNLAVGRLAVGDRLMSLAGVAVLAAVGAAAPEDVTPRLAAMPVDRIVSTAADPATPLYNLRLDGDHTYVANDLLVHNK